MVCASAPAPRQCRTFRSRSLHGLYWFDEPLVGRLPVDGHPHASTRSLPDAISGGVAVRAARDCQCCRWRCRPRRARFAVARRRRRPKVLQTTAFGRLRGLPVLEYLARSSRDNGAGDGPQFGALEARRGGRGLFLGEPVRFPVAGATEPPRLICAGVSRVGANFRRRSP